MFVLRDVVYLDLDESIILFYFHAVMIHNMPYYSNVHKKHFLEVVLAT